MKEKTKAYMAGMVDAEGCIRMAKTRNAHGRRTLYYAPSVYVTNQSRILMNWCAEHFGGRFMRNKNRNAGSDWYVWYLCSRDSVESFLNCILPYLRIKREQANCLLAYLAKPTPVEPEIGEECFQALKAMKRSSSVTTETHSDFIKADQSYLSGFFDGEGCIRISRTPAGNTISYHLGLQVTNTDLPSLKQYQRIYGGHIRHKKGGRCYDWILSGKPEIEKFLLHSLPYLVVKREEAILALEYIRLGTHTQRPAERQRMYEQMAFLKKSKIQPELHGDMQRVCNESCMTQTQ